ncbi:hypothetical protein EVAR_41346_1 [Eumeta japonica]|uniref:Uncharacterized protein n=1 Tax=Eumeta variegata TaxID=151549 RepID=A0A4C1XMD4_EUMVA|nr:hypothetical protein EVAR_41346_1 [Eumeta japonica]
MRNEKGCARGLSARLNLKSRDIAFLNSLKISLGAQLALGPSEERALVNNEMSRGSRRVRNTPNLQLRGVLLLIGNNRPYFRNRTTGPRPSTTLRCGSKTANDHFMNEATTSAIEGWTHWPAHRASDLVKVINSSINSPGVGIPTGCFLVQRQQ